MEQRHPCDPSWLHPNSGLWTALYICSSLSDNFKSLLIYCIKTFTVNTDDCERVKMDTDKKYQIL